MNNENAQHKKIIEEIIERIAKIRVSENLSQRELSLRIGKNAGYIHMLESSKSFAPTLDTLLDILDVFEMSVNRFFYEPYEDYKTDSEIIRLLKTTNAKKKEAILTLLKNGD